MGLITPVILSGGAGTRLWPLSRESAPKQFLPLVEGRSTFEMALERVADGNAFARPMIVTASTHRFLVDRALKAAAIEADVVLEPVARNTAAAIAAAAILAARRDPHSILLVLAADHLILDKGGFVTAVETALFAAEEDLVVTFGVVPDAPSTAYGYIGRGAALPGLPAVSKVAVFKEKPDAETAKELVTAGYLWNSGNFMVRAVVAIAETQQHVPDIAAAVASAVDGARTTSNAILLAEAAYRTVPAQSFDYAVMEHTDRAAVVEARFDWRDIGTWESLSQMAAKDSAGNASVGDVVMDGSHDSYVHAGKNKVALLGVDNVIVATGGDAVLVAARDRLGSIKDFVAGLERDRAEESYKVSPWGYFEVIGEGDGYKVKRIVVEPGARLSLQRHKHRAEHWVVVSGVAEVTIGDDVRRLDANKSAFIPQGEVHRLANPGRELLTVIEVQYGTYLGEDDIERLSDDYDRLAAISATGES